MPRFREGMKDGLAWARETASPPRGARLFRCIQLGPHNNVSATTNVQNNSVLRLVNRFEGVAVFILTLHASRTPVIIDAAGSPPFLQTNRVSRHGFPIRKE